MQTELSSAVSKSLIKNKCFHKASSIIVGYENAYILLSMYFNLAFIFEVMFELCCCVSI